VTAARRGRSQLLSVTTAAVLALAGCGGGAETGGAPPNASPSSGSGKPGPAQGLPENRKPAPPPEPAPSPKGEALTAAAPATLGKDVPAKYLPSGFPLPKEAKAAPGFSDPKPDTGNFYLRIDAPIAAARRFFQREYVAEGWKPIKDETSQEDGRKGFDLLFTRKNSQQSAGFTAEERDGSVLVQVYYNDSSKL